MDKMEILNGVIEENIEWFWNNDSIVDHETDIMKLWDAFKIWCVQNCLEVVSGFEETFVEKAVDRKYSNWANKNTF